MMRKSLPDVLISAVLPVYNEVGGLQELFRRVRDAIQETGARQEIIFVDDGSTDGSAEMITDASCDSASVGQPKLVPRPIALERAATTVSFAWPAIVGP